MVFFIALVVTLLQPSQMVVAAERLSPVKIAIAQHLLRVYENDSELLQLISENADYAVLSWAVYDDPETDADDEASSFLSSVGWKEIECPDNCKNKNFIVGDTVAALYSHADGRIVLAFRGTKNWRDWITNIAGTSSIDPLSTGQVAGARELARKVYSRHPNVVFTGHSLGGRLSQVARLETGNAAVVFNSAPIGGSEIISSLSGLAMRKKPLTRFRGPEDPLTELNSKAQSESITIENIVRADDLPWYGELSEAWVRVFEQNQYFHGPAVLARAMLEVQTAVERGWIDSTFSASAAVKLWKYTNNPTYKLSRGRERDGFANSNAGVGSFEGKNFESSCQSNTTNISRDDLQVFISPNGDRAVALYGRGAQYQGPGPAYCVALIDLKSRVVIRDRPRPYLASGEPATTLFSDGGFFYGGLAWSPDGRYAATTHTEFDGNGELVIFDFDEGKLHVHRPAPLIRLTPTKGHMCQSWEPVLNEISTIAGNMIEAPFEVYPGVWGHPDVITDGLPCFISLYEYVPDPLTIHERIVLQ